MPKKRRVFKGLTSYAYPTQEKLEYFIDAIEQHHLVDADTIHGNDPHYMKQVRVQSDINEAMQCLMDMKYL